MTATVNSRQRELHALISNHLQDQSSKKEQASDKKSPKTKTDNSNESKVDSPSLLELTEIREWAKNASAKIKQLKIATHLLKASHPYAKGTNVFCEPQQVPDTACVSSKYTCDGVQDVVGNAACLGFYSFLMLDFQGSTILELIDSADTDLAKIFSDVPDESQQLFEDFLSVKSTSTAVSSHTFAKQLYWLIGDEPLDDTHFHILAPQYSSALAQYVYEVIRDDLFGDLAKSAREAKKKKVTSELTVNDYADLAIQKLGGSKPQNISKLNANRSGINYLLPSLPPTQNKNGVRPIYWRESFFRGLERHSKIRAGLDTLRKFLDSKRAKNEKTRDRREDLLCRLIDEIESRALMLLDLEPGWTKDERCKLSDSEKLWLDPGRSNVDTNFANLRNNLDWQKSVSQKFGSWMNNQLGKNLELGDVEFDYWSDSFFKAIFD